MHDNATHNSNAAHDDADINNEGDVDDVEQYFLCFIYRSHTKPGGLFVLVNRE